MIYYNHNNIEMLLYLGWSKDPGPTNSAGRLPAIYIGENMQVLSVFVDESGDFGEYAKHAPYYIVTMLFHDQSVDVSSKIKQLDNSLVQIGYGGGQAVHTEPLIRRENPYQYFQPNERRSIFSKLYYFALSCDIKYKSFVFHKNEFENNFKLESRIARDMSLFIQDNLSFFQKYDKIILYYDNGYPNFFKIQTYYNTVA